MPHNAFSTAWVKVKKLLAYSPPRGPDPFVLDEERPHDGAEPLTRAPGAAAGSLEHLAALTEFARRLALFTDKTRRALRDGSLAAEARGYRAELAALEKQWAGLAPLPFAYGRGTAPADAGISTSLSDSRRALEGIFRLPRNRDVVLREIMTGGERPVAALLVYTEGLAADDKLDRFVIEPLMRTAEPPYGEEAMRVFALKVIPNGQVRPAVTLGQVQEGVNMGDTALFFDGVGEALIIETKGWEHRGVESPKTEQTVRGSLSAFNENLRVNTGLVRSILRSSDLVTELVKVGSRGQLNCALMYIDSIANPALVAEVKRRLEGIATDYVADSAELAQFIEDSPTLLFPQSLSTERPDRVAVHLAEGRVALILEGNPFAQILPVSFFTFFHSAEDFSMKSGTANFMRVLRLFGTLLSVVLPSLYLSLSYFHQEAMPTELLLAVAGSRENVPFPAWFEVLVMEVSFELIREAGIRIPGMLSSTIGIVGAIILGQAAVAARVVSPIVVVVVAITGLASFTIPEFRMASAVRIMRFLLFIIASTMGLVGLAMAILGLTAVLCRMKSFGVPYLAPVGPRNEANYDVVTRGQVFDQEARPDELGAKDRRRQPKVSRRWTMERPAGKGEE